MLVSTRTIVALHCPKCGKMELSSISRFSCGQKGQIKLFCECGSCLLLLTRKSKNLYCLQVECLMCDSFHNYKLTGNEIWNRQVYTLYCQNTGLELGYLGQKGNVIQAIQQEECSVRELMNELEHEQYFLNPVVMLRVLDYLRDLLGREQITCGCGRKQLETDIFPDRVEVHCPYCHAIGIIFAESEQDWQKLEAMQGFELEAYSCRNFDDKRLKKKRKVKNK